MKLNNKILVRSGKIIEVDDISDFLKNDGKGLMLTKNDSDIDMMIQVEFDKLFIWMIYPLPMNGINAYIGNYIGFIAAANIDEAIELVYRHITPIDSFGCLARITIIEKNFKDGTNTRRCVDCPPDLAKEIYTRWEIEEKEKAPKLYSWVCERRDIGKPNSNTMIYHGIVNATSEKEAKDEIESFLPYETGSSHRDLIHLGLVDSTKPFEFFSADLC